MASGLNDPAKLKSYKFSIPFIGEVEWIPDSTQRKAAWELFVELTTRNSLQPLDLDQGLIRESLSSLYSLFATTRQILRSAGPDVGVGTNTVGGIAIVLLNKRLRPFLSRWHPLLHAHECLRPPAISPIEWERMWKEEAKLRGEMESLRSDLEKYATALAEMAGVKD